jgi:hypothetical protein
MWYVSWKGSSMHIFTPAFFSGNSIVGAQVPMGAGVVFAHKYRGERHCIVPATCRGPLSYATKPPGGASDSGSFPSFSLGPQHQKGEALKEYVCALSIPI